MRSTAIVIAALGFVVGPFASSVHAQDDPIVDTDRSRVSTNVTQEELERIPTGRDPWKILQLTPGVVTDPGGVAAQPGAQGTGASPSFYIDGIVVGDPTRLPPTPVDIGDIQVITGNFPAEYGDVTGGVINVITKTGDAETRYPFYFGGRADGVTGRGPSGDLSLDIKIPSGGVNGVGSACVDGARLTPRVGATYDFKPEETYRFDFERPIEFKLDTPIYRYIEGLDRSDATGGSLPPCPDAPAGTPGVFFQWEAEPRMGGPLMGRRTHFFFGGGAGPYEFDMGSIGERYGIPDASSTVSGDPLTSKLDDTHVFSSDFYITGLRSYVNDGFKLEPRVEYKATPRSVGEGGGFFIMGVDMGGVPYKGSRYPWSFQMDFDHDGTYDSAFLQRDGFREICPGVTYGGFKVVPGEGGGYFEADPDAPEPDCDAAYLQDRVRLGDYFSLNLGVRADAFENEAMENPGEKKLDFSFSDMIAPRVGFTWDVGGAHRTNPSYDLTPEPGYELGGPIIRDKLWIWGSYGPKDDEKDDEPRAETPQPLTGVNLSAFNPAFLRGYVRWYDGQLVWVVGKPWDDEYYGEALAPVPLRDVPGGGIVILAPDPTVLATSLGGLGQDAIELKIFGGDPRELNFDGLVLEPVDLDEEAKKKLAEELSKLADRNPVTAKLDAYCLDFLRQPPRMGTVFRISDQAIQQQFASVGKVLAAGRRLHEGGLLHPDGDPEEYFHSIRQWSVWASLEDLDAERFADAFIEHTRKNFETAGEPWSDEVEAMVRQVAPNRWDDISRVLDEAGESGSGPGR
jgi:hypothetical protein